MKKKFLKRVDKVKSICYNKEKKKVRKKNDSIKKSRKRNVKRVILKQN